MSLEEMFEADRRLRVASLNYHKDPKLSERLNELRRAAVEFGTIWNRIERAISRQEDEDRQTIDRVFSDQKIEQAAPEGEVSA